MTKIDPRLAVASDDVVEMLQKQIAQLKDKPSEQWNSNDIKNLETLNKIVSVCLERKPEEASSKYTKMSDSDLESGF